MVLTAPSRFEAERQGVNFDGFIVKRGADEFFRFAFDLRLHAAVSTSARRRTKKPPNYGRLLIVKRALLCAS